MCVYVTINVNFHDNTKTRTTQNLKKANIKLKTKNINQTNSPHPFVLLSKKIGILFQKVALKLHFIGLFAVYCNKHNLPLPTSNNSNKIICQFQSQQNIHLVLFFSKLQMFLTFNLLPFHRRRLLIEQ